VMDFSPGSRPCNLDESQTKLINGSRQEIRLLKGKVAPRLLLEKRQPLDHLPRDRQIGV